VLPNERVLELEANDIKDLAVDTVSMAKQRLGRS
jgi:hypothetical protein